MLWLDICHHRLSKIENVMALISGIAIFSLMFLAVLSVGGRNFFNSPLLGYVDWIEQIMPVIAFTGIAYVQREGHHIRMDIVVSRLKGRVLWAFELITCLAIFILMVLLLWGSYSHFGRSFDPASPLWSRDSSIDIGLPIWPTKLLVAVAFFMLCLRLFLQIISYSNALYHNKTEAIGIAPLKKPQNHATEELSKAFD